MDEQTFLQDLKRAASRNRVTVAKEAQVVSYFRDDIAAGAEIINVYLGAESRYLVLTTRSSVVIKKLFFTPKVDFAIAHSDVEKVEAIRGTFESHVYNDVVFRADGREHRFRLSFNPPDDFQEIEISGENAKLIAREVEKARTAPALGPDTASGGDPFMVSADAPDQRGDQARNSYGNANFADALRQYESAIEALYTLYGADGMRQRQPSATDAWIVDGYTGALGVSLNIDASLDVTDSVRTVTHRLRVITSICKRAGLPDAVYAEGLREIKRFASNVNVDDILWE